MKDPAGGVCVEEAEEEEEEGGERKTGVPAAVWGGGRGLGRDLRLGPGADPRASPAVPGEESFSSLYYYPSLGYPHASCHRPGGRPHLCLFLLWRRDVEIEASRMVDSVEKWSVIVFLEQPKALEWRYLSSSTDTEIT
ncbi:uncharacterized protein LOC142865771 isoform X2 [Microcebus murinus]|uniref:uncharacterized protein LOC142865771 isoform X2 n=1 Tax=Microcebus murinus TaxID=30608 RepID=UPI003F6CE57B